MDCWWYLADLPRSGGIFDPSATPVLFTWGDASTSLAASEVPRSPRLGRACDRNAGWDGQAVIQRIRRFIGRLGRLTIKRMKNYRFDSIFTGISCHILWLYIFLLNLYDNIRQHIWVGRPGFSWIFHEVSCLLWHPLISVVTTFPWVVLFKCSGATYFRNQTNRETPKFCKYWPVGIGIQRNSIQQRTQLRQ